MLNRRECERRQREKNANSKSKTEHTNFYQRSKVTPTRCTKVFFCIYIDLPVAIRREKIVCVCSFFIINLMLSFYPSLSLLIFFRVIYLFAHPYSLLNNYVGEWFVYTPPRIIYVGNVIFFLYSLFIFFSLCDSMEFLPNSLHEYYCSI